MAAGSTYTPIATTTLGSAASSYTFSSIPSIYTDLVLIHAGTTSGATDVYMYFNGDTGSNYSRTYVFGDGSTAGSARQTSVSSIFWNYQNTSQSTATASIMNYANSTTYKTVLSRENPVGVATAAIVGLWRSTAAINSITIGANSGTLSSGSTLTLYGIAAA